MLYFTPFSRQGKQRQHFEIRQQGTVSMMILARVGDKHVTQTHISNRRIETEDCKYKMETKTTTRLPPIWIRDCGLELNQRVLSIFNNYSTTILLGHLRISTVVHILTVILSVALCANRTHSKTWKCRVATTLYLHHICIKIASDFDWIKKINNIMWLWACAKDRL